LATGLFAISVLLALWLMHTLAAIALGDHEPRQIGRCVATLLAIVLLMVATRYRLPDAASAKRAAAASSLSRPEPGGTGLHPVEVAFQ
jgi:hypothetical protein